METICPKDLCTGCTACESICPKDAIRMIPNITGFTYPDIDQLKCIDCGLCKKVCPSINESQANYPLSTHVAAARNNEEQLTSASGGLASVISRYFLTELNGVVYGCTSIDFHHIRHIRVDSLKDLDLLKGSKYVQSDLSGIFNEIRKDLRQDRYVLFIGTPCQNAGLRNFLRKDFEKLFCVDFICHGVPSQKMLNDHIKDLSLFDKCDKIDFRYKKKGVGSKYCLLLYSKQRKLLYKKPYGVDYYISGFILGLFYRESCYKCKYAKVQRCGDLTIGDYWDKDKRYSNITNSSDGLSQLHINTQKGQTLIDLLKDNIDLREISLESLKVHSHQLCHPMPKHQNHESFILNYPTLGFKDSCKIAMLRDYRNFKKQRLIDIIFFIPGSYQLYKKIKNL